MVRNSGVHLKGAIEITDIIKTAKESKNFSEVGGIGIFIGVVRGKTANKVVKELKLEAYKEKADEILEDICSKLKSGKGIVDVQIHHLTGKFSVGEDLVYVLVAGAHREEIFLTLQDAINQYKQRVPIFKKEHVVNDQGVLKSSWISEKQEK